MMDPLRAPAPIGHRTMAVAAADELRRRVLDGVYPGGHPLRQDALAAELGISRIPLREALVQLESEGLVKILPHRGAVVAEASADEIAELFDLRALLEPRLLLQSAPALTEADYRFLDALLQDYDDAMQGSDASRWGELNTAFHVRLYQHATLPRTLSIVTVLLQGTDRYTRMQLALTDGRAQAREEHVRLVELCRAGDVESACALLADHIRRAGRSLEVFLRARQGAAGHGSLRSG
ncbi:MAG: GntR family transcriptional regulator [Microvirga sp.]